MRTQVIENALLGEQLYGCRLDSGLQVFVLPKRGYHKVYASFATHYGSIDSTFVPPGGSRMDVPPGIAHFLEHTLFEDEEGNVSDRFAQLGASSNAYTSYTHTNYLFSCTDAFEPSLDLLLDYVQNPYFTEANVRKEMGIIEQEIAMLEDMPDRRVVMDLMCALYAHHPVRLDIAGTVDSVRQVTPELLHTCYRTFYHPENMVLLVLGDVDPARVIERVAEDQAERRVERRGAIERIYPAEPDAVCEAYVESHAPASRARLLLGLKDPRAERRSGTDAMRTQLLTQLVSRALLGRSSALYNELYDDGLIDDSFFTYFEAANDYGYSMLGGETDEPDRLLDRLRTRLHEATTDGLARADFERVRRAAMGRFLDQFNSLEYVASSLLSYHFLGASLFESVEMMAAFTWEEANERLREHFQADRMAAAVLRPQGARG